jgi:hypothetical protein
VSSVIPASLASSLPPRPPREAWSRGDGFAIAAALIGGVICVLSALRDPGATMLAWLEATTATLAIALGALAVLTIEIVAHASWTLVVRRALEAIVGTLPLQALFFLPIALAPRALYPWAMTPPPLDAEGLAKLAQKRAWLDVPFWQARAVACFAIWIAVAALLRAASRRQDEGDPAATSRLRAIAGGAMPPLAITLTIAAFDWLMSLEPAWVSNAYGMYLFVAAFSAALALAAIVLPRSRVEEALGARRGEDHRHALGNLLLAAVILWAYIAFAQLLILWLADLPEEIVWYLRRVSGGWARVAWALGILRFAAPFLLLLSRDLKRRPRALAAVATLVLIGHAVDVHWLLAPSRDAHPSFPLRALAALLTTAGLTFVAARQLARRRDPLPRRDPSFAAAARFEMS